MKSFFKLLLLLVLITAGFLVYLLRNDFEKISQNRAAFSSILRDRVDTLVFTKLPRSARLFLLQNLPGAFPAVYVCTSNLPDGGHASLFSGDLIQAGNTESFFSCPGGFEGRLKAGAQVQILPREGAPSLKILQGQVEFQFNDKAPRIDSQFFTYTPHGQAAGNRMAFSVSPDGFAVACLGGQVSGPLYTTPEAESKKNFVLIRNCLFSLRWVSTMPEKHLMPGDLVAFSDLEKGRKTWQPQDLNSAMAYLGIDPVSHPPLMARIDPVPTSPDTVRLSWSSPAQPGLYDCTLYSQENNRSPTQIAHRFQAQASAGELTLLKGFLKFWLSVSCTNGQDTLTSNVIAPML